MGWGRERGHVVKQGVESGVFFGVEFGVIFGVDFEFNIAHIYITIQNGHKKLSNELK